MYIKFLIASSIFAGICFGIGAFVCTLVMLGKVRALSDAYEERDRAKQEQLDAYEALTEALESKTEKLERALKQERRARLEQRKQIALLKERLGLPTHRDGWVGEYEGERIATPSSGMVRNDNWEDDGR